MAPRSRLRRLALGLDFLARKALLVGVVGLALVVPPAVFTVEYTARSEYCNSCHIMEPYYESWQNSSHSNVACIECHYEPGVLETVEGKFKALSQLAKYVTRTQGTKPWAEVSDQSCMRSGCHSVQMLEGPIAFGRIQFDHRHHLLETRRGRRLRCTSCHSQIVQGDHVSVTEGVCFMCHFMPDEHGERPAQTSNCLMCHGPPEGAIQVAGEPFEHQQYTARGVACTECHVPVITGDGMVRQERCHSCHAEVGHIERIGETAFLHEMHVTEHKVECFECHDEIQHGLLPLEEPARTDGQGCSACHFETHDANRLLYAGTGAVGVEDHPSRMYETRVVCTSCHTGRSGVVGDGTVAPLAAERHSVGSHGGKIAAAGAVDCIHCHGPDFAGMLGDWQTVVQGELDRLRPLLAGLSDAVGPSHASGSGAGAAAGEPLRVLYSEAERNLSLVEKDGSRGAHNPLYALAALRAGAERIESAYALLDPDSPVHPTAEMPFVSSEGCSACHLGVERLAAPEVHGRPFPHARHLQAAGLDCGACHRTEAAEHGQPAFPRNECGSCHHQEAEGRDPWQCATCHKGQEDFVYGEAAGFEPVSGPMEAKECTTCHGEPPDVVVPGPQMCALCHDQEHAELLGGWNASTDAKLAELEAAIQAGATRGLDADVLDKAREARDAVRLHSARGAHNAPLTEALLQQALDSLR